MGTRINGTLWAMVCVAPLATLAGCGKEPDPQAEPTNLGGLLRAEKTTPIPIDLAKAAEDVDEILRALAQSDKTKVLGAHKLTGKALLRVRRNEETLEELETNISIVLDKDGNYAATSDNSREYGRHAIFVGDTLYLRPRFGKYHRRPPNDPEEPMAILREIASTPHAHLELVAHAASVRKSQAETAGKRDARKFTFELASTANRPTAQALEHRKWRQTVEVEELSGFVVLDADTAAPLSVTLTSTSTFEREGDRLFMELSIEQTVSDIGHAQVVTAPAETDVVSTPARLTELDERNHLLEGIAAPSRRSKGPKKDSEP